MRRLKIHMRAFTMTMSLFGLAIGSALVFQFDGPLFWCSVLVALLSVFCIYFEVENIYKTIYGRSKP